MAARLRTFSLPFSRLAIASRQFSSDIKAISCPMDVPLPGAPLSRHVRLADLPVRETRVTTLENGIQVASEDCFGQYCTVGALINAGSRYEVDFPSGVSHFISKLAFQSTCSFSHEDLMQEFEKHGGMLDCQYHRDTVMYGTTGYSSECSSIMRLLSEAVFKPNITDNEMQDARERIAFELEDAELKLDPEPILTELIHTAAFRDNTLGLPKLCPPDNINTISRQNVLEYLQCYYKPLRLTVCGVGIDHDAFVEMARDSFGHIQPSWENTAITRNLTPDNSISQYTGGIEASERDMSTHRLVVNPLPELAHVALGFESCSFNEPDFFTFAVLNSLLGGGGSFSAGGPGKGMYSRLYLDVLNRYSWVQNCTAYHHAYNDSGLFCIYGSSAPSDLRSMTEVLITQFLQLTEGYGDIELSRAKEQLKSMLMMNLESRNIVFEDIGRQVLATRHRQSPQELCDKIDAVTSGQLQDACQKMLKSSPSVAAFGNLRSLPSLDEICTALTGNGRLRSSWRKSWQF
ncbi:mitochondrial-processing peptidase subunit alpha-like [Corticium candelabrum]|uniref:mitochondrial-processing peptidase subunit alpha-like n=1 Tax=Corticium candelabrum TaxID=121492 RepID=UPI002E2765CA|nr:mitochondrial-processing peptidase subunit alpha-like [Corticium candelabrum]